MYPPENMREDSRDLDLFGQKNKMLVPLPQPPKKKNKRLMVAFQDEIW